MITVHKTVLKMEDEQEILVTEGAEFLHAQMQHDLFCIWYRLDTDRPRRNRRIFVAGTGHPAPATAQHVGTLFLSGGTYVFHVFAERE